MCKEGVCCVWRSRREGRGTLRKAECVVYQVAEKGQGLAHAGSLTHARTHQRAIVSTGDDGHRRTKGGTQVLCSKQVKGQQGETCSSAAA